MAGEKKSKKSTKKTKTIKTPKVVSVTKKKNQSKTAKKTVKVKEITQKVEKKKTNQKFYEELKLSESYVSLILGAAVVLGIFVIFFVFIIESRKPMTAEKVLHTSLTPTPIQIKGTVYIMQENESLWDLAVKFYGDGFAYIKIVDANKNVIDNPDYVPPGTKIIIPPSQ